MHWCFIKNCRDWTQFCTGWFNEIVEIWKELCSHKGKTYITVVYSSWEDVVETIFCQISWESLVSHTRIAFCSHFQQNEEVWEYGIQLKMPVNYFSVTFSQAWKFLINMSSKRNQKKQKSNHEEQQNELDRKKMKEGLAVLSVDQKRAAWRNTNNNCSLELNSLPSSEDNFDLSKT